jgi:carbon-monoxide dehydrogenase small subunit
MKVNLNVNGSDYVIETSANRTLLDVLREDLGLTGTKYGCGDGECGTCTVLVDGVSRSSCMMLIGQANGKKVETVEGLAKDGKLHPLQEAFIDKHAIQCGYCTPGMLMSAKALLDHAPDPTEEQIREAISGNLCRCTGYQQIVDAILAAAEVMKRG